MAHGGHLDVGLESVGVGVPELLELGRPCQRADHVDVDAVFAPLGGGDAGHTADALLGGSIGRLAEVAEEAGTGSEVDDAAVRLSQIGVAGLHVVESGVEAGVDGQIELLGGVFGQRHAGGRSLCIVDEHLNAAEGIDGKIALADRVKGQSLVTTSMTLSGVFANFAGGIMLDALGVGHVLLAGIILSIVGAVIVILTTEKV